MRKPTVKIGKSFTAVVPLIIAVVFPGSTDTKKSGESGIYEPPCCDGSWYEPPGTVLTEASLNRPSAGNSVVDPTFGTTDGIGSRYFTIQN